MTTNKSYDICVVGGGILGSLIARNCARKWPHASIGLLESEQTLHSHNSSRNSGVLHAGLFYAPGSLKAKMSVEGARQMKEYCKNHQIPIHYTGKLVIPSTAKEHTILEGIYQQGIKNGVDLQKVDKSAMLDIDHYAKASDSFSFAVYSPSTAVSSISGVL